MLKWAVRRRLISSNVIADINAVEDLNVKKGVGTRSLNDEEIKLTWLAVNNPYVAEEQAVPEVVPFYGCRNGELRVSNHTSTLTKPCGRCGRKPQAGKSHRVLKPIIPEVAPLIAEAFALSGDSQYVFTNRDAEKVMGQSAPIALPYGVMQYLRRHHNFEMEHWSVHDLRKTARTNFSTLTAPHIAEIMLGHKLPGQWQVYDHYDYLKEQTQAYTKWWARLMEIVADS